MPHQILFLAAQEESGGLSLPAMTIIAMLLLMLPYIIRRYTGKSVTEWLRFSTIIRGLETLAAKLRSRLPFGFGKGNMPAGGLSGQSDAAKAALAKSTGKPASGNRGGGFSGGSGASGGRTSTVERNRAENERSRAKQRAGNVKNDYLHTVSEILTFARKNKLFTIMPGNIENLGKTADLTALLVTRSRVVGILAYGFDGKILCRWDEKEWQVEEENKTRQIGRLNAEASRQDQIVRGAMKEHGMQDIPYQTAIVFTSSGAVLAGDRPAQAFTREAFFESLRTEADLHGGAIDPKATGKKLSLLRSK